MLLLTGINYQFIAKYANVIQFHLFAFFSVLFWKFEETCSQTFMHVFVNTNFRIIIITINLTDKSVGLFFLARIIICTICFYYVDFIPNVAFMHCSDVLFFRSMNCLIFDSSLNILKHVCHIPILFLFSFIVFLRLLI